MRSISSLGSTLLLLFGILLLFQPVSGQDPLAVDDYFPYEPSTLLPVGANDVPSPNNNIVGNAYGTLGTIINYGGGTFGYIPPSSSFTGTDSFRYKYCYGLNGTQVCTAEATVTISVIGNGDQQNLGTYCEASVGKPVNVTSGNMWIRHVDYAQPANSIQITRFYNSKSTATGLFGYGWSSPYDESLSIYDSRLIRLNQPDGRGAYFSRQNTTLPFRSISPEVVGQLEQNLDGTYTLTYQHGESRRFSAGGKLLSLKDANGNETALTYDTSNRLTAITDPFGKTVTVTPNTNGTVAQISDTVGVIADYEYFTGTTQLKTVAYPDGSKYKFEYVTVGTKTLLATVKDALDNVLETHAYDSQGRATTSEKHGGVEKYTIAYTWTPTAAPNSGLTTVTDALGNVTKYYFFRKYGTNLITKLEGVCGGCGGSGSEVTQYQYDESNNLTKKIDALNRQTSYYYDGNRNLVSQVDPLGTQKWAYNALGQVLTYKDRVDQATASDTVVNTYDTAGNLLTTTDALGKTTTLTYTMLGQLATLTDARNNTTEFTYDTQGRLTTLTDANDNDTTFGYDARARVTSVTNAKNETTTFEYDLNNRLKKVTFPDTNYTENTYDLAGRRTQFQNARGKITTFAYDNAYRLTSVTDPLSHARTFGYDLMSNLTSQTDALGNTTDYEYDTFDRLKKIIYPPATTGATRLEESVTYDKLGNVKTRVDTAGRTTAYDYDTSNRLTKITDALTNQTQFEYNLRSQMTKVKDALNQEYVFTYDPLGRTLSQTRAGTTMSFEYDSVGNRTKRTDYSGRVTNYEYDDLNRLTTLLHGTITESTFTYDELSRMLTATNGAGTVTFGYDNRGRLSSETDVFGRVLEYGYDPNGNRISLELDNGVHTSYAYDDADRLSTLTDDASESYTYGYDIADRLVSKIRPNNVASYYEYDGLSRLTRLKDENPASILFNKQYSYNTASQISQIAETTGTRNFSYDNLDRLTGMTNGIANENYAFDSVGNRTSSHLSASYTTMPFNRLTAASGMSMSYDANGNMTNKTVGLTDWTYTWDRENRMTSASSATATVSYGYDALGRRVTRSEGSDVTEFTNDGQDVVLDDRNGVVTTYQNGLGIDDKLATKTGTQVEYFLQDHLGSTAGLTDSTGVLSSTANYDSFGNQSGSLTTRYAFTGREYDATTGLNYYRARMYDPQIGRFISEDPIGFAGGDVNLYGYVWNNPLHFTDPMGLDGWGNDFADWADDKIEYSRRFYQPDPDAVDWNTFVNFTASTASGFSDMFRVGSGLGQAIYCEDNGYGMAPFIAMDIARAAGIAGIVGGVLTRVPTGTPNKGLGTNPFRGKTPPEIDGMLKAKGYQPKGPNPLAGDGTYVNPKNGRGYHIDAQHPLPKGPHVGVHRPRSKRKTMKPRDYPL